MTSTLAASALGALGGLGVPKGCQMGASELPRFLRREDFPETAQSLRGGVASGRAGGGWQGGWWTRERCQIAILSETCQQKSPT